MKLSIDHSFFILKYRDMYMYKHIKGGCCFELYYYFFIAHNNL